MFNTPVRRVDAITDNAKGIIASLKSRKIALEQTKPDETKFLRFTEAMSSGRFAYKGMDIYKEADTDTEIGRIWFKKEYDNPVTGQKEAWLCVYTNDDEDISRQIVNGSLQKVSSLAKRSAQNVQDWVFGDDDISKTAILISCEDAHGNKIAAGSTVTDESTGRVGTIEGLVSDGEFKKASVKWENGVIDVVPTHRLNVIASVRKTSKKTELNQELKIYKTPELWETDFINLQPGDKVKVKKLEDTNYNDEQYKVGKIKYKGDTYYISEDDYNKLDGNKKIAAAPGAPTTPKPKDIPLAPGIQSKNITMNQGGADGTAKVEINFSDPQQGLDFYQTKVGPSAEQAPPVTSVAPQGQPPSTGQNIPQGPQPAATSALHKATTLSAQMLPMLFEQKYPPNAIPKELKVLWSKVHDALRAYSNELNSEGVDDVPDDFPDSWYEYSTPLNMDNLHVLREYFEEIIGYVNDKLGMNFYASYTCQIQSFSKKGRELVPIIKETADDVIYRYSFVNESGNRFLLPWKFDYKVGSTFMRPDNNELAKIAGYQTVSYKEDRDLVSALIDTAHRPDPIPGGVGAYLEPEDVSSKQLEMGLEEEKEHSPDYDIRQDISLDHLKQDPSYYTKLRNMEKGANKVSNEAEKYISKKIEKLINEGYDRDQAAAIAYSKARKKGYDVPEKSSSLSISHVVKEDGGYFVTNEDKTKKLNKKPKTKEEATKMLQAIEINKHKGSLKNADFSVPEHKEQRFESGEIYPADMPVGSPAWVRHVIENIDYKKQDNVTIYNELYRKAGELGVHANISDVERWYNAYLNSEHFKRSSKSKIAADISDEIPPMGWTEKDSKLPKPDGAGSALPPDKDLQNKPADQESGNVLYDSNKDKGPQYQVTMDPGDSSIKIKYIDSEAKDALENALNNNVPEFNKSMTPAPQQQPPGQPQPAAAPPPTGGQQNSQSFNNQNVPVSF
jgi:hypothetical protein